MRTFIFTGFAKADLFGDGHIAPHASFTMPDAATLEFTVTDDDSRLSGDLRRNERGDDRSGQEAQILRAGEEVGNGGTLYAEQLWHLYGDDGRTYRLVELEQPGRLPDSFTYLGPVPPAGVTLTVGASVNVFRGVDYEDLSAGPVAEPAPNIVDIAAGSDDFNILVQALTAANLVDAVRNSDDITVFAPTDAAFTALAVDLGFAGDTSDEGAVFGFIASALAGLAPDGDPIPLLTDILLYHVSPGAKTAAEVDAADQVTTLLNGATFGTEGTELVDNEPDVANPSIVGPDVNAANGTIQVIDRVLLPIDIPGNEPPEPELPTLAGIVAASGGTFDQDDTDFDVLLTAVQTAGLVGALDDPEADLTVFAPNDAAFVALSQALGFEGSDEGEAFAYLVEALTLLGGGDPIPLLTEVLTYHVAPEALGSEQVLAADQIATLQGGQLGVAGTSLVDADPDVPNPTLIATDIAASNGIAHVLDGVLLPADLLQSDGSNDVDFIIDDDTASFIRTGRDNDLVDGNGGNDKIALGTGNDVGFGGDGHDIILGGRGMDTLTGGLGDDTLFGGRDADIFVFNTGDGHDRIVRFEDGLDLIDLSGTAFESFADLEGAIKQKGNRAEIKLGDDQSILVQGARLDLSEDDFLF
ncbi:fasciclin domain-containing protein [Roseobacter sinensis]|uniref:Fasciclin domain-containing protein n=1 Tax=Roseobacter sinensis TaxID=2931391 RepID=A0ABT3BKC3_9RHOB|nr:fasciclin domain-containing protein [Roseobacter sp. WL0113]MCV3274020.1 fasciclin domain-containing protein [Roseobacter sp. WL0113]